MSKTYRLLGKDRQIYESDTPGTRNPAGPFDTAMGLNALTFVQLGTNFGACLGTVPASHPSASATVGNQHPTKVATIHKLRVFAFITVVHSFDRRLSIPALVRECACGKRCM